MTIIKKDIDITKPLTKKQIKMLEESSKYVLNDDEGFTDDELKQVYRVKDKNRFNKHKQKEL